MSKTINSVPVGNIRGTSKIPVSSGSSAAETTTVNDIMGFVINNGNLIDETEMNSALAGKQATLVSGTNIKTINGNNLLGSGNITLQTTDDRSIMITATTLQALGSYVAVGPQITQPVVCENKVSDKGSLVIFDDRGPLKMWPVYDRRDNKNLGILITVDLRGLQPTLVSGTNIKTINGMSILGSGNLSVQPTLVSGTNIKTINNNTLLGSGNIDLQTKLVSGTSIKTINGQSLLGSGNISISGGSSTPGIDARSDSEFAHESLVPDYRNHTIGTQSQVAFGDGLSVGDLVVNGTSNVKGVAIKVDTDTIQSKLVSGTSIKTINNQSLLGSGNITISGGSGGQDMGIRVAEKGETTGYTEGSGVGPETGINPSDGPLIAYDKESGLSMTTLENNGEDIGVMLAIDGDVIQSKLVSGNNIKTVNNTSLLGSGNINVQPTLVSGTNIKTINNQSILGSGNISIGGGGGGTDDYTSLNNLPQINGHTLVGNMSTSDIGIVIPDISTKQDTLVSGTNIKTVNNQSLLGSGNISITQAQSDWNQSDSTAADYIKNKPTIPDAQVQSDWNQDNTQAKDYIKNRPNIPAAQVQTDWNASTGMGQILNKPNLATVATSGSYNDLTDKPTIPSGQVQSDWNQTDSSEVDYIKNKPTIPDPQVQSDWTATTGMGVILHKPTLSTVATSGDYTDLTNKPNLATVATTGNYNDLSNTPTIPDAQIQSDWNQTDSSEVDYIKNKPSLATVATTGAYSDLSGTPTLSTVATTGSYTDLTNKPTIPAAQIQSDWNQTNTNALDYIKNKPTVPSNTETLVFTLADGTTVSKTFYTT